MGSSEFGGESLGWAEVNYEANRGRVSCLYFDPGKGWGL